MKTHCNSAFPDLTYVKKPQREALAIFIGLITPLTIVLNSTLMYGLYKSKEISKITGKLIFCVSLSDFCIGLILQPMIISSLALFSKVDTCTLEWMVQFLSYYLFHQTGTFALLISIDRYFHMRYLTQYNLHMTTKRSKILIGFGVGVSFTMGILSTAIKAISDEFYFFYNLTTLTITGLGLFLIFIIYAFTYNAVRRRTDMSTLQPKQHKGSSPETTLLKTVMITLSFLFFSYMPYQIVSTIWTLTVYGRISMVSLSEAHTLEFWAFLPVLLNSILNSMVYSYYNRPVRKVFDEILCFFLSQDTSNQSQTFR